MVTLLVCEKDGDLCTKNSDCINQVCLPSSKRCSSTCASAQDCSKPNDSQCTAIDLTYGTVKGKVSVCIPKVLPCTKTKSDKDCPKGSVCNAATGETGTFSLRCFAANASGSPIGYTCTKNENCNSHYCKGGICSNLCDIVKDCPANYLCSAVSLTATGKTPIAAKACTLPTSGLPCKLDADCKLPQAKLCQIVDSGSQLDTRCKAKSTGVKKVGESCQKNTECASNICIPNDGICSSLCSAVADCEAGFSCLEKSFSSSGGTKKKIKVCGFARCAGDYECKSLTICVYRSTGSSGFATCQIPDSKKKLLGQTCSADLDCASKLCHKTSKTCASLCETGKDLLCPLQYICEKQGTGPNNLKLCVKVKNGCGYNGDCSSGDLCVLTYDSFGRAVRTCKSSAGSSSFGLGCNPKLTNQCDTGVCDPVVRRCTRFCTKDSQCAQKTRCSLAQLTNTPSGGKAYNSSVRICRSGSCRHQGECGTAEVCQVNINPINNAISTRCQTPEKNKKEDRRNLRSKPWFPW